MPQRSRYDAERRANNGTRRGQECGGGDRCLKEDFGIALPANFFEDMGARIIAAYPGKLRPMDGILELLTALKLRRCVASNSPIERVRQALATTGLIPHVAPHIYSAAMVERGKLEHGLLAKRGQNLGHCCARQMRREGRGAATFGVASC
jgi:beta-phosphoglucomutase-like phosphatase (HAD superfamily)